MPTSSFDRENTFKIMFFLDPIMAKIRNYFQLFLINVGNISILLNDVFGIDIKFLKCLMFDESMLLEVILHP